MIVLPLAHTYARARGTTVAQGLDPMPSALGSVSLQRQNPTGELLDITEGWVPMTAAASSGISPDMPRDRRRDRRIGVALRQPREVGATRAAS